jgi:tetratricopeptide (TPR) repeat protein
MKLVSRVAIALLLAAPLAEFALPAPAAAQTLPQSVGRPLQAAQAAARAGNNQAALNAIQQARSAATTPAERRAVAQMAAYVHTQARNYGRAAAELESIGAPPAQLAPLYYQARQYDKAIEAARRSGQTTIIAQSYMMQGNSAEAAKIYQQLVDRAPNNVNHLSNLAAAQYKMGDRAAYQQTVTRLIRLDPSPQRWRTLLGEMKNERMSREAKLGLYHLMRQTGGLTTRADVEEFAKLAITGGQPGAAIAAIQDAARAGVVEPNDPAMQRLIQAAAQRQQQAQAQAPAQARSPQTAFQAGNAFLGAGQYQQATAAYITAQKGPNAQEATLYRGIAELLAGNPASARATLGAIKTGPVADVANLWTLYASTRG